MSAPQQSDQSGSNRSRRRGLTFRGGAESYTERVLPRMLIGRNSEVHRLRIFPIALAILAMVPLLVGVFFLWANEDPTKHLDNMKVAVVNEDQPTQKDGQPLNVGKEVVDNLKKNPTFDWQFVDKKKADDGLAHGKYFATVQIPQDFSSSVASIGTQQPHQAVLNFEYNDANGKTASTLLGAAAHELHSTVNESISNTASAKVFSSLNQIHEGMGKAADGSGQLKDGINTADDGAKKLNDGASKLVDGAGQLNEGSGTLAEKLGEAQAGSQKLADGAAQLNQGAGTAYSASQQLASGSRQVADGNAQLAAGLDELNSKLSALQNIPVVSDLPQVQQLLAGVQRASDASHQLADGSAKVADGNSQLSSGLEQLSSGAAQLNDGSTQLNSGIGQLKDGADRLHDGASQLDNGERQLASGISTLSDGTGKLSEGAETLHTSLAGAQDQVPAYTTQMVAHNADALSSPSQLSEKWLHKVDTNGEGLAPFLAGFGLFLGGLFVWQVVRPLPGRNLAATVSAWRLTIRTMTPALLLGILQVFLLVTLSWFALDIRPDNLVGWTFIMLLGGFGFLIFQQALIIWLGSGPGQLLGIVALVVQLASAGGLYPVETSPKFFQVIHPFMPLTWMMKGMNQAGAGQLNGQFWQSALVLIFVAVLTVLFMVWGVSRKRIFTMKTLYPAVV